MNKTMRKLTILSLILPVFIAKQAEAFPGKNALKKAGYAGAAVVTAYAGYQAAKAYGLDWHSCKNWLLGNDQLQELLEKRQSEIIKLRDETGRQQAQNSELVTQLQNADQRIAALETQETTMLTSLKEKADEKIAQEKEIKQLADLNVSLLNKLQDIQQLRQTLPVQVVSEKAEPIYDLTEEYITVLKTNAINVGSIIHAAKKAFDGIAPFLKENYAHDQILINFGTTYDMIRQCQAAMASFNEMIRENNYDLSQPAVLKQAEGALKLLYSACDSINSTLPLYRTKLADKATSTWGEWFKGKDAQILEEFDSFKLSFEQRLKQLHPIKNDSLTQ